MQVYLAGNNSKVKPGVVHAKADQITANLRLLRHSLQLTVHTLPAAFDQSSVCS